MFSFQMHQILHICTQSLNQMFANETSEDLLRYLMIIIYTVS